SWGVITVSKAVAAYVKVFELYGAWDGVNSALVRSLGGVYSDGNGCFRFKPFVIGCNNNNLMFTYSSSGPIVCIWCCVVRKQQCSSIKKPHIANRSISINGIG